MDDRFSFTCVCGKRQFDADDIEIDNRRRCPRCGKIIIVEFDNDTYIIKFKECDDSEVTPKDEGYVDEGYTASVVAKGKARFPAESIKVYAACDDDGTEEFETLDIVAAVDYATYNNLYLYTRIYEYLDTHCVSCFNLQHDDEWDEEDDEDEPDTEDEPDSVEPGEPSPTVKDMPPQVTTAILGTNGMTPKGESKQEKLLKLLNAKAGQGSVEALKEATAELNALIGLPSIKAEVKRLTDFLNIQSERRKHGLRESAQTLHFVFRGNPGTGKTTVARIIGKFLFGFGFLKTTKFVECGRSDLVGGYLGQTAIKTDEKVQEALDGVLFIDEAYTLARDNDDMYGQEAIDTLLKRMEDFRERLTIIVAGYPRLMDGFLNSNPGLKSRFTRFLYFEDYRSDELVNIFGRFCQDSHYVPDAGCRQAVSSLFTLAYRERDETFGNARYVRNVFEDVVNRHSQRLTASGKITDRAELMRLDALDVPLHETLIGLGKRRGFVSFGQVNAVLQDDCTDEQVQALLDSLQAHGVEVLSDDEAASRTRQAAATESRVSELHD